MRHFWKKQKRSLVDQYDPESAGAIEIQRLFKTVYGKGLSDNFKSLMVTSAMPQEGKSLLVGNLALVAAYANRRTLIIDADMRRPVQHRRLYLSSSPGLTDFLQKDVEFNQILHNTEQENLKLIPCGTFVPSAAGLLQVNISQFKVLLDLCQMHFDVILVDVPPVLPVNDAEVIAPFVDGVMLVVLSGKTYREIISRAVELLENLNCNLVGMVLNNVTKALPYYYNRRYYRYHQMSN